MGFIERKMRMPIEIVCRESHARVCCKVCNAKISPLSTADEKIRIEWLRLAIARSANKKISFKTAVVAIYRKIQTTHSKK
jgi:hypothetical protein